MFASELVSQYGNTLIGRIVYTHQYGDWPGGESIITEINPDPYASEISFLVKHTDPKHLEEFGEMGVFENEYVDLIEEPELYTFSDYRSEDKKEDL